MNKKDLVTIIIPCKNEEKYINVLLDSLRRQSICPQIIIADAKSTDDTLLIIESFSKLLDIVTIDGGDVSYARNQGALLADTKYLLFIDADMELRDSRLIEKTINAMVANDYDLATTNLKCNSKNILGDIIYYLNNIGQRLSAILNSPFSTGAFMCIKASKFKEIGGFDEDMMFCEDYWLSKQIDKSKFGIIKSNIYTSDRRFKKIGYWWMIKNFILSYLNRNNREYFTKDFKYWD
jgi:glycosyltransferase involved in cell wall biosynthesis